MPANLHHAQEYLRQQLDAEMLASAGPRVQFVSTVEDAVREADLAIDCVPDELESKLEICWLLDRMAPPRTVLATPTTRLSIADLAGCTYRAGAVRGYRRRSSRLLPSAEAGRCIGAHASHDGGDNSGDNSVGAHVLGAAGICGNAGKRLTASS